MSVPQGRCGSGEFIDTPRQQVSNRALPAKLIFAKERVVGATLAADVSKQTIFGLEKEHRPTRLSSDDSG